MKTILSTLAGVCALLGLLTTSAAGQQGVDVEIATIDVPAPREAVMVVKLWPAEVWLFTPADDPIDSLRDLSKDDIACGGVEHRDRMFDLLDASGIGYEDRAVNLVLGTPVFDELSGDRPRLYIAWSNAIGGQTNAVRVRLVEESTEPAKEMEHEQGAADPSDIHNWVLQEVDVPSGELLRRVIPS